MAHSSVALFNRLLDVSRGEKSDYKLEDFSAFKKNMQFGACKMKGLAVDFPLSSADNSRTD